MDQKNSGIFEEPVHPGMTARKTALWIGSFLTAAVILIVYFRAPLLPVLGGGVLALIATLAGNRPKQ